MAGAQWLGWAPPPIQRPSGTEGLGAFLQALGQMRQNQLFGQDVKNLGVHQQALSAMDPAAAARANVPTPNMRSMQMQQMMAPGMLQALMPMTPFQQQSLGIQQQGVDISAQNAETARLKAQQGTLREVEYYDSKGTLRKTVISDANRDAFDAFLASTGGTWADPAERARVEAEERRKEAAEGRAVSKEKREELAAAKKRLQLTDIGEQKGVFDPETGEIIPTEYPSAKVPSTIISLKQPPAKMIDDLSGLYDMQDQVGDMARLFDEKEVFWSGKWEDFKAQYGLAELPIIRDIVKEPSQRGMMFRQIAEILKEDLARKRSGGQITASEFTRLDRLVPNWKAPGAKFKSDLKTFAVALDRTVGAKRKILRETGYIVPGETQVQTPLQTAPERQQPTPRQPQTATPPSNKEMLDALNTVTKQMPNSTPQEQAAAARALLDGKQLPKKTPPASKPSNKQMSDALKQVERLIPNATAQEKADWARKLISKEAIHLDIIKWRNNKRK